MSKGRKQSAGWNWSLPVTNRVFDPYTKALGQLALAWNELHETLSVVFCVVMGGGMVNQFLAIWHEIKVDRAQRDILLAAAKAGGMNGSRFPRLIADLEWIWKKARDVEDARNDALHSPLWGSQRGPTASVVMPMTGLGHLRARKLEAKDLLSEFRWCRDATLALTAFARELDGAMTAYGLPWPDRPRWPNRGQKKEKSKGRRSPQIAQQNPNASLNHLRCNFGLEDLGVFILNECHDQSRTQWRVRTSSAGRETPY